MAKHLRGVDPVHTPLAEIPPMQRAEAMAHFDDWVTDSRIHRADIESFMNDLDQVGEPFHGDYAVWTSSGTTGTPGLFIHDPIALAIYDALELVRSNWPSWPILPRWTPWPISQWPWPAPADRYAVVCMTGGHFATLASVQRMRRLHPWLNLCVHAFDGMLPTDQLAAQLQAFDPQWLASYPSSADLLADAQRAGSMRLQLKGLWTGGETLDSSTRARLTESFDCPIRDDYGASECLPIAWECPLGALHVNEDWVLLEPVDRNLQPVPPGAVSDTVLLTNLANHLQPLLRYDLGDRVTRMPLPCRCGSPFMTIRVEGRDDDILELANPLGRTIRIAPLMLVGALEDVAHVHAFQLVRQDPLTLELRMDTEREASDAMVRGQCAVRDLLQKHGLHNIRIVPGPETPWRHPVSGKLRRVMTQVC